MTEQTQSPNAKTISITRALSTIKTLETQLTGFFTDERYLMGIAIGTNGVTSSAQYPKLEELKARITSDVQKLEQLRATQFQIKRKIIESNATTKVTVGGTEITVAEAIFMKSTLSSRREVLNKVRSNVTNVTNVFAKKSKDYEDSIQKLMTTLNEAKGASPEDAMASQDATLLQTQIEYVKNTSKPELFDPAKIRNWIDKEQALLDELTTELDYTLSASNTNTMITVTGL